MFGDIFVTHCTPARDLQATSSGRTGSDQYACCLLFDV